MVGRQFDRGSRGQAIENHVDVLGTEVLTACRGQRDGARPVVVDHAWDPLGDLERSRTIRSRSRTRRHTHVAVVGRAAVAIGDHHLPRVRIVTRTSRLTFIGGVGAGDRLAHRPVVARPAIVLRGARFHPDAGHRPAGRPGQRAAGGPLEVDLIGDVEEAVHGEVAARQLGQRGFSRTRREAIVAACGNDQRQEVRIHDP